ncbi:MAG TPA: glucose-6-phosphate isomerase, partial [Bacteroidota bacterium]|nr:glucose-6-phosphate isomerase [Bacteroidota bacterium]
MSVRQRAQTPPLKSRRAWKALEAHYQTIRSLHLRQLFDDDPKRGERFSAEGAGWYLDYSKNRITGDTIHLLIQLAEECALREWIEAMFNGEKINATEQRAALHTALRTPNEKQIIVDGKDAVSEVHEVLEQMEIFARNVRSG